MRSSLRAGALLAAALGIAGCAVTMNLREALQPGLGNVLEVSAGAVSACAINLEGGLYCWGTDRGGVLGFLDEECAPGECNADTPREVMLPERAEVVSVGRDHACAVTAGDRAFCWGRNDYGQLGSPDAPNRCRTIAGYSLECSPLPVEVGGGFAWHDIAAGDTHTCGVADGGVILCWGNSDSGRLGASFSTSGPRPQEIEAFDSFVSVTADSAYACGRKLDGRVLCWGSTPFRGGADETTLTASFEPFRGERFSDVDVGLGEVCAATTSGIIRCLGGERVWPAPRVPVGVPANTPPSDLTERRAFSTIAVGDDHACAVGTDQVAECWGANDWGQLGDGTRESRESRDRVMQATFLSVSAGGSFSCGVTPERHLRCWGSNRWGALAQLVGEIEEYPTSVRIPGETPR